MNNTSEILMLSAVTAFCPDCGDDRLFLPIEDGCDFDGCEFCCTSCDAAVFLMQILENTGTRHSHVA